MWKIQPIYIGFRRRYLSALTQICMLMTVCGFPLLNNSFAYISYTYYMPLDEQISASLLCQLNAKHQCAWTAMFGRENSGIQKTILNGEKSWTNDWTLIYLFSEWLGQQTKTQRNIISLQAHCQSSILEYGRMMRSSFSSNWWPLEYFHRDWSFDLDG